MLGDTSQLPELSESFKQKHSLQEKWKCHVSGMKYSMIAFAAMHLEYSNVSWAALPLWAGCFSFFVHAAVTTTKISESQNHRIV